MFDTMAMLGIRDQDLQCFAYSLNSLNPLSLTESYPEAKAHSQLPPDLQHGLELPRMHGPRPK